MTPAERLEAAAAKLSKRAAKRDTDRQYLVMPSARAQFVQDAQEARAMAAVLRTVHWDDMASTAALALANAVLGDPA